MILAIVVQRWRMRMLPEPAVELRPRFSLDAKNGIPRKLERHEAIDAAPRAC